jgi:hypothetical protein
MRKIAAAAACVVLLGLGGCGVNDTRNERRGRGDAPVGKVDDSPKEIIQFPDRFSNVSHACDGHGHRVFVTTQTDSGRQLEIIDDKSCD